MCGEGVSVATLWKTRKYIAYFDSSINWPLIMGDLMLR